VFVGIAVIAALGAMALRRRRFGPSSRRDPGPILVEFGTAFPEEAIRDIILTEDGETAFLRLADDKTGFVRAQGKRYLMRIIPPGGIVMEGPVGARGLAFGFGEGSGKPTTYIFGKAEEAAEVSLWLCGNFKLTEADGGPLRSAEGL
ncbi:MAG TPA: hypothetical protein VFJ18_07280, partial [Pararhizobium sp.]|nr:hypothetical protein [Pararhizobium sp.]